MAAHKISPFQTLKTSAAAFLAPVSFQEHIQEVKALPNPPSGVRLACEGVCIMFLGGWMKHLVGYSTMKKSAGWKGRCEKNGTSLASIQIQIRCVGQLWIACVVGVILSPLDDFSWGSSWNLWRRMIPTILPRRLRSRVKMVGWRDEVGKQVEM